MNSGGVSAGAKRQDDYIEVANLTVDFLAVKFFVGDMG